MVSLPSVNRRNWQRTGRNDFSLMPASGIARYSERPIKACRGTIARQLSTWIAEEPIGARDGKSHSSVKDEHEHVSLPIKPAEVHALVPATFRFPAYRIKGIGEIIVAGYRLRLGVTRLSGNDECLACWRDLIPETEAVAPIY
jgi:hypothetical protein